MAEDIRKHLPDLYGACGKRASFFMPMKLRTYVQTFNMSQQAFTFSGEAAKSYDQYLGPFLFEPSALMLSALVPPHYKGQVLELAAGTGRLTQHLVRRLANPAQLTVTDLNPDMLAIAEKRLIIQVCVTRWKTCNNSVSQTSRLILSSANMGSCSHQIRPKSSVKCIAS